MKIVEPDCEISIFMPVYNGGRYLQKSIESILNQTFENFELVCVDDTSADNSFEILKAYAVKDSRIRIFRKSNGGMVPKSWNFVMPYLRGKSITYMSQDDFMSEDNLACMYYRQKETEADCVLPDMVWYYEGKSDNKIIAGNNGNREKIITNREAVALSLNWKIHGFALWKADIFKNRKFEEDIFNSDELFIRESFLLCNKIAFCKGVFYYRQDNKQAITKTFDVNNYYSVVTSLRIYKLLENNRFDESILNFAFISVIYSLFYKFRYSCLHKKELSKNDFVKVRLMFYNTYKQLNIKQLLKCALNEKSYKRFKFLIAYLIFFNYYIFKAFMFCIYLYDKGRFLLKNESNYLK